MCKPQFCQQRRQIQKGKIIEPLQLVKDKEAVSLQRVNYSALVKKKTEIDGLAMIPTQ